MLLVNIYEGVEIYLSVSQTSRVCDSDGAIIPPDQW